MAPFISPHAAGQRYRGLDYSPRSEFGEPRAQFRSPRRGCRQPARWPIALSSLLHHAHGQWAVCVGREYALPTLREPIPFPGHPPGVIPRQSRNVWTTHGPHISIFASFSQDHAAVAGLQRRPWRWRNSLVAKTCSLGNGRFLSMVAAPKSVRHPLDCFAGLCVPALGPEHAGTTPSALSLTSRLGGTR